MADQMRWDTINELYTPNLVKLRSRGLNMANTYSSTPSCTPARSALLTGLSPWYNGMLGYGEIAPQVSKISFLKLLTNKRPHLVFDMKSAFNNHNSAFICKNCLANNIKDKISS